MNNKYLSLFFLFVLSVSVSANSIFGAAARSKIKGAVEIRYTSKSDAPAFIQFAADEQPLESEFSILMQTIFKSSVGTSFKLLKSEKDGLGYTHTSYQQYFKEVKVEHAKYIVHSKNGKIESISGFALMLTNYSLNTSLSEVNGLKSALSKIGATSYKWELVEEENNLKMIMDDVNATYYPKGELVILPYNIEYEKKDYRTAWKFNIYAHDPMSRAEYYIDATTGELIFTNGQIHTGDSKGTAVTVYSGNRNITTDSTAVNNFRLRESERGNGIITLDCNTGTSYGAAVDFTDTDNAWNNINAQMDEYATDAHWGAEQTYDYFFNVHNRNSIDGNGFALYSYVHYDQSYANAFWDGQRMSYGDGNPSSSLNAPLTAIDIAGHEIAHGLTSNTANLIYQRESGALNESFSDIFGTAIEFYARPNNSDWLIGDDLGNAIRSMVNPNAYGDPDTYGGTSWRNPNCGTPVQTNDYCGVHSNSGVQNYWFYLLTNGGSGTNDLSNAFSVNGLGIDTASKIAFRSLTVYLSQNSTFADARFYSIRSAIDLYGACSPQVQSVTNAWYAVGVGNPYQAGVASIFNSTDTSSCIAPHRVVFKNNSNNGTNFLWRFGDGTTSTLFNPVKTYTAIGNYDVTLVTDGGACGIDSVVKVGYISVDTLNLCNTKLVNGTNVTQTGCNGKLFDSGGSSSDYEDNTNAVLTIAPSGASSVRLDFINFDVEAGQGNSCNYDYLEVFDGPSVNDPSLGIFCNNNIPTALTSTRSAITLRFITDAGQTEGGFEINWSCILPTSAPTTSFYVNTDTTCSGLVQFFDYSLNGPSSWSWDFGDGTQSTIQNPNKVYTTNGLYNVKLKTTNGFGTDSTTRTAYITVRRPRITNFKSDTACPNGAAKLSVTGTGTMNWYDASSGGNLVGTGNPFTAPLVTNDVTYYAEATSSGGNVSAGAKSNSIGTGASFTGDQHLNFTALKAFKLKSVLVYANGGGNRTIQLRNSNGAILISKIVNIPNGTQRVTLDFDIPVGVDYQLGVALNSNPDLYRNNAGAQYPYNNGIVNITSNSASGAALDYYYFFYDWEVQEVCKFSRIPVTAYYDPNCIATSIAENSNEISLKLMPNPTNGDFKIQMNLNTSTQAEIFITNLSGQVVRRIHNGVLNSGLSNFNVNSKSFENGIYFVSFRSKNVNKVMKLVVID
jgi:Zn-dependent metalloprotease